ncbi:hypothetical protein [Paenibacillus dokdonensis]|uniref:hypothetical protein n=1 Tax=Paenibacillus dokdonensis TaxID=2567944 RepID=UPI0010A8A353|nr:hypothetical protein [Paenibacillus dokdonensis]
MRMPITNANAGMVIRLKDANHYYMYRTNSSNHKLELYKTVDIVMTLVSSTSFAAKEKECYTLNNAIQGNTIQCYMDGQLKVKWTNPLTELTAGKIGLRTTSAGAVVGDVLVQTT